MPEIARADVIGSLLRPDKLRAARAAYVEGRLPESELHALEDEAVLEAIALQDRCGIDVITDGEFRRTTWIITGGSTSSARTLSGVEIVETDPGWWGLWRNPDGTPVQGEVSLSGPPVHRAVATGKVSLARDFVAAEYPFLRAHTHTRTKFTVPAPSWHRINWDARFSREAYATPEDLLVEMRDLIRGIIEQLIGLGCDYVQLDAPNYAQFHTDPQVLAAFAATGRDMDAELAYDVELDNSVFEGIGGITRAMHVCRGNAAGGRYMSSAGYDRIAPVLFPALTNYDRLLLEYDTPRAGDFSPLDHVLPGTEVVLGLVSTKSGVLEDDGDLKMRIAEAAGYVPLDLLALSPQCGFASNFINATTSQAEQEAKLRLVGDVAHQMWG